MSLSTSTPAAARPVAASRRVLPQRRDPVLQPAPRQPFTVLQTGRAPAQLSLWLRGELELR